MDLHRPSGNALLGFTLAATTMVLWALLPFALALALEAMDAVTITFYRFLVAAGLLALWLAARGSLPPVRTLGRTGWALLVAATLGLTLNYVGYLVGLGRTSPANAAVLIQTAPLLLALGGIFVFRERFTRLQWFGFLVLVAGIATFFASQLRALAADLDRYLSGVAILGFAAVTWAGYGLAQKQLLRSLPSQGVMLCIYVGCALCLLPGAAPAAIAGLDGFELAVLAFCALNTLIGYGAFAASLEHWEASRVSAVLALTPLTTLLFSWLAQHLAPGVAAVTPEQLTPQSLLGAALVVAGSITTSRSPR